MIIDKRHKRTVRRQAKIGDKSDMTASSHPSALLHHPHGAQFRRFLTDVDVAPEPLVQPVLNASSLLPRASTPAPTAPPAPTSSVAAPPCDKEAGGDLQ